MAKRRRKSLRRIREDIQARHKAYIAYSARKAAEVDAKQKMIYELQNRLHDEEDAFFNVEKDQRSSERLPVRGRTPFE